MREQDVDIPTQSRADSVQGLDQLARHRVIRHTLGVAQQVERSTHGRERRAQCVVETGLFVLWVIHHYLRQNLLDLSQQISRSDWLL